MTPYYDRASLVFSIAAIFLCAGLVAIWTVQQACTARRLARVRDRRRARA